MPVEAATPEESKNRSRCTRLEALGRSLAGIAPWLELAGLSGDEKIARDDMTAWVIASLDHATDPASPDFMDFEGIQQALVDSAFLAQGLLRARTQIWDRLDRRVQQNVIRCLQAARVHTAPFNNWLLFAATVEAFLGSVGEPWDRMRVDYAVRQHMQWYVGDGVYGDGPFFHWDYYNSFVIQPMLLDVLRAAAPLTDQWKAFAEPVQRRAARHAAVLERLIAPDGSFPVLGRSMCYRFGAFQTLAQAALLDALPAELPPAQVRCALTAVFRRVLAAGGTFDASGWLQIGLCGHQPELGEFYISTGSLYLCLTGMLPIGLPPEHPFWSGPDLEWTSVKVWLGQRVPADHAIYDSNDYTLRVK